jgi:outer membrane protein assembly factor BamD (BamD/ComL family)
VEQAKSLSKSGKHFEAEALLAQILAAPALGKDALQEARELYVKERLAVEAERKASALFDTALDLVKDGKFDAARTILKEIIKKFPETEAARTKSPPLLVELLKKK